MCWVVTGLHSLACDFLVLCECCCCFLHAVQVNWGECPNGLCVGIPCCCTGLLCLYRSCQFNYSVHKQASFKYSSGKWIIFAFTSVGRSTHPDMLAYLVTESLPYFQRTCLSPTVTFRFVMCASTSGASGPVSSHFARAQQQLLPGNSIRNFSFQNQWKFQVRILLRQEALTSVYWCVSADGVGLLSNGDRQLFTLLVK